MSTSAVILTDEDHHRLVDILWGYRQSLTRIEALLEAQLLLAGAGRDVQLGVMADLVEETANTLGELDLRRALLFSAPVPDRPWGGGTSEDPSPSLRELAEVADEAWAAILNDHQRWFEACVQRIQFLTDQSRHSQQATLDLIRRATGGVAEHTVAGYDREGETVQAPQRSRLFEGRV